jgi:hypothetical protein
MFTFVNMAWQKRKRQRRVSEFFNSIVNKIDEFEDGGLII